MDTARGHLSTFTLRISAAHIIAARSARLWQQPFTLRELAEILGQRMTMFGRGDVEFNPYQEATGFSIVELGRIDNVTLMFR